MTRALAAAFLAAAGLSVSFCGGKTSLLPRATPSKSSPHEGEATGTTTATATTTATGTSTGVTTDPGAAPDASTHVCSELAALSDQPTDATPTIAACLAATPDGGILELPAGRYTIGTQLKVTQKVTIRTAGQTDASPACSPGTQSTCAELRAAPAFATSLGMVLVTGAAHLDHLVLEGNPAARNGSAAYQACASLSDNTLGFNAALTCSDCGFSRSVSQHALCGSGFLVGQGTKNVVIRENTFFHNGVHDVRNLWSDGLTVLDTADSQVTGNTFVDDTDVDMIFGGCQRCKIESNTIQHDGDKSAGSFAALMIQKWPNTSGDYQDVSVTGNTIDCGPTRNCGSALYIGSESWYDETPFGTMTAGTTSGEIHDNTIRNAQNGVYIAAIGLAIYRNGVLNAHGGAVHASCGDVQSPTPYLVSPVSQHDDFRGENVDATLKVNFTPLSWRGCIPNWPF